MAVNNNVTMLWNVMPHSLVDWYQCFRGTGAYLQDRGNRFLQNINACVLNAMASDPSSIDIWINISHCFRH